MPHNGIRALTGLVSVAVIAAIVAVAVGLFQGSFSETMPVTVLSPRGAGGQGCLDRVAT
jgi:phospholipid/cholesterol/gamma-HCH transport system substrate-binding protein